MTAFKIFTMSGCSPIQGGDPVWDARTVPFELPRVRLDTSARDCAPGWNYTEDLASALKISGLWPDGWSALAVEVEPGPDAIKRGDKCRASTLTIVRVLDDAEVKAAVAELSAPFGPFAEHMAAEQWAWYEALRRPHRRDHQVEEGLRRALKARDLDWSTRGFDSVEAAWAAWDARDARDARAAWAAWDARAARAAWDAWAAWDARDAWAAWDARDARDAWAAWAARAARAAWAARDARAARAARAALTVQFAAKQGWITHDAELLTAGIRDAYLNGLGIAVPTAKDELGWAMAAEQTEAKQGS